MRRDNINFSLIALFILNSLANAENNKNTAINKIINKKNNELITDKKSKKVINNKTSNKKVINNQLNKVITDKKSKKVINNKLNKVITDKKSKKVINNKLNKVITDKKSKKIINNQLKKVITDKKSKKVINNKLNKVITDKKSKKIINNQLNKVIIDKKSKKVINNKTSNKKVINNNGSCTYINTVIPKDNKYKEFDIRNKGNKDSIPTDILKEKFYKNVKYNNYSKKVFNKYVAKISIKKYEKLVKVLNRISHKSTNGYFIKKTFIGEIIDKQDEIHDIKVEFGGKIQKIYVKKGDVLFEGQKIAKIKSASLLLFTTKYLRLKQEINENIKTLDNIIEMKIKDNFFNKEAKDKEIERWKNIISDKKDKIYKMEKKLISFNIKSSKLTSPIGSYNYIINEPGILKNIYFPVGKEIKDNTKFLIIEQKNKYYLKTYIPYKYIKSINKNKYGTALFYNNKIFFKFYKILKNDYKLETDSVGIIFYSINPINKLYLNNLIPFEIEVY